ncbi:MAG: 50S ribosomal protein L18 [Pseudomonadota bacterium]
MSKKIARLKRAKRSRIKMRELGTTRLVVHRTSKHIYAQVVSADENRVVVSASTAENDVKSSAKYTGNIDSAKAVGQLVAKRAIEAGVTEVAFDRSGFKYHGRIKALADAAREGGLQF